MALGPPLHDGAGALPLFTCMFLHGGFLHILGNMWFLWIFGGNVEDRFGPFAYLVFYMVADSARGFRRFSFPGVRTFRRSGPAEQFRECWARILCSFPRSRILTLVPLFIIFFLWRIPAIIFIGLWFAMHFLSGVVSLGQATWVALRGGRTWEGFCWEC